MPAQKRLLEENTEDNDLPESYAENHDDEENDDEDDDEEEEEEDDDDEQKEESDGSTSSSSDESSHSSEKEEFILVRLSDVRKEVQCPICLGIIRKTRTVMECLHRFCRECIDKSMRMGNNECPACRKHCASRRSLRDDPNFDSLIAALYPDIDQYEEEELAFQEDEKARNKQIQAAIAQTLRRQSEALTTRKRRRSHGNYRRRRNCRSEDEDDANGHDGGKDSSSADERCTELKPKRLKRWKGQPSPAATSGDGGGEENEQEVNRDAGIGTTGLVGNSEMLVWGRGGMRSNTRYGSGSGGNGKHARSRLAKLGEHLRNLDENDNELDMHVVLVSLDEQKAPVLQHSYLCGRPTLSVGQLCQFIALQTSLPAEEVEILAAKSLSCKSSSLAPAQGQISSTIVSDTLKDDLQVLNSEETLAGLKAACNSSQGRLMLAYRQKVST